ncbi:cobalt-precorrin-5B (C(1))-methyltransferase CbiD [Anaerosinus massiliensis]|uniref:cobalt-precorrin-5B (C(1))-methyltransferase CbiD n=1 Tax=Massilibacillus massiliensis TaxID=1806837 RepID=UPI000A40E28F|nr:cobalt-precorrin-5B (C(1))-methyltransferase CbiD [Massilibacillus massiliensis]
MKKELRCGFTTGACAAAGAKAAVMAYLNKTMCKEIEIYSPQGEQIIVPIKNIVKTVNGGIATVTKDAGDDPDITDGIDIIVEVKVCMNDASIKIRGAEGIGIVTKPGLSIPVGQSAINLGPQKMIRAALSPLLEQKGCEVIISVPDGEKLAKRTLNSTLGVEGGLSIIGTSGIVRPMSEEAFKNSLAPQISVAKALGYQNLVLVPGKIGQEIAIHRYGFPKEAVIQTSNFIGHMLECAVQEKIKNVILLGHLGKLVKVAAGIFHTHNRIADARLETLAAYAGAMGAPQNAIKEILNCTTTEAAMPIITQYHVEKVYELLAARASERAKRYVFNDLNIGTVIVTLKGDLLGMDESAKSIGGTMEWNIK